MVLRKLKNNFLLNEVNGKMSATSDLIKNASKCPECGGDIIVIEGSGDTVCNQCGLILEEKSVDFSHAGRRSFNEQEKKNRDHVGSPISIMVPDISLTTTINRSEIKNPDLKRAAKWDTRITWQKRNLLIATTELKRISSNLNVPDYIMKEAMRLYKIAFSRKLLRGRSINGMVAACLYYALRKEKIPITFQEILDESAENENDVKRCYSALIKELKLKIPSREPSNLIPRFASKLGVPAEVEQLAIKITKEFIKRFGISGKDPRGLVAAALYLAGKIKHVDLTQNEIATLIGITEVTLRSRCKEIKKKLNIFI